MVGPDSYIQGTSVEIGVEGLGGFEGINTTTSPPPAGYHGRSGGAALFGFVANPQLNSWLGSAYDGDFFTPGSPENGWGFQIGATTGTSTSFGNNCAGLQQINGAITGWSHNFNCYNSAWEGDFTSGTDLHFKIDYFLQQTDLYYTTTVSITNNTAATIPDMYYYRNVDPDNNESIGASFTTTNTIVSEPGAGCDLAHVKAEQSTPWANYLGFAATGANWRVDYGGFSNRGAADMWTGTGYTQTIGSVNTADEAISIAYRIQNLAPGATETFKFVVILDDASATAAINNLLYLTYPGSLTAPPSVCTPWQDTIRTCGGPVPIAISGPIVADFNWTWSPTTGLTPPIGPVVSANPATTTTYTVTGTPIVPCVSPVTLTFVVMVTPGGGVNPVISPVAPVCVTTPPFNFTADTLGGTWTGTGITSGTAGTFDPSVSGAGTFLITYTTLNTCNSTDTAYITVSGSDPTITPHPPVCQGSAPYTLTAASPGGTWSGTGITSASLGTFDPTTAGAFTLTYSLSAGACSASDTVIVIVNPTTPPVTGISYTPTPVCTSAANPVLATVAGFTSGGTFSVTPAGLALNTVSGAVNLSASAAGTYTITYSYAATGCGPAGSSTTNLTITPLTVPTLGFTYPTVCSDDSIDTPVLSAGFTTGGTFTAPAGVSINDSTGVIDLANTTPGTYTITYAVIGSSVVCTASGSNTATVTINPLPTILLSLPPTIFVGQSALIYASGGTTYSWTSTQYLSTPSNDSTIASPPVTTDYCVAVTDLGCTDTNCVKVTVEVPCPSNRTMGVPNAFTPNGDGINDQLCLDGWGDCISKFEIIIYNRW
ncbi:MAG: gliding motility-associated C-terminal domain-containing protein, partial [Bacteroidetes bacterium]|nr:gliding motility-associated C-terminal domain-containing protein [Bacteroidota bacterium]